MVYAKCLCTGTLSTEFCSAILHVFCKMCAFSAASTAVTGHGVNSNTCGYGNSGKIYTIDGSTRIICNVSLIHGNINFFDLYYYFRMITIYYPLFLGKIIDYYLKGNIMMLIIYR